MSLEGRIDWTGPDPEVIQLTDNGTRKVQIRLHSGRPRRHLGLGHLELAVNVKDVDTLIRELEEAKAWMNGPR